MLHFFFTLLVLSSVHGLIPPQVEKSFTDIKSDPNGDTIGNIYVALPANSFYRMQFRVRAKSGSPTSSSSPSHSISPPSPSTPSTSPNYTSTPSPSPPSTSTPSTSPNYTSTPSPSPPNPSTPAPSLPYPSTPEPSPALLAANRKLEGREGRILQNDLSTDEQAKYEDVPEMSDDLEKAIDLVDHVEAPQINDFEESKDQEDNLKDSNETGNLLEIAALVEAPENIEIAALVEAPKNIEIAEKESVGIIQEIDNVKSAEIAQLSFENQEPASNPVLAPTAIQSDVQYLLYNDNASYQEEERDKGVSEFENVINTDYIQSTGNEIKPILRYKYKLFNILPTHPSRPIHPTHPTHPINPTHPTHPTHPINPINTYTFQNPYTLKSTYPIYTYQPTTSTTPLSSPFNPFSPSNSFPTPSNTYPTPSNTYIRTPYNTYPTPYPVLQSAIKEDSEETMMSKEADFMEAAKATIEGAGYKEAAEPIEEAVENEKAVEPTKVAVELEGREAASVVEEELNDVVEVKESVKELNNDAIIRRYSYKFLNNPHASEIRTLPLRQAVLGQLKRSFDGNRIEDSSVSEVSVQDESADQDGVFLDLAEEKNGTTIPRFRRRPFSRLLRIRKRPAARLLALKSRYQTLF